MDWEAIRKNYPQDASGIDKARCIHDAVAEKVRKLDIPRPHPLLSSRDVIESLPYSLLAEICSDVWKDVAAGPESEVDMEKALKSFVADEPFPEPLVDFQEILSMLLRPAVTVYLRALREGNHNPTQADWNKGSCPFCGAYPRMALDSETSRELACLLCGMQWRFRRIACPFCGNTDHETLGYFDVEGIEGVRVQYCSQCRHYLKVVDTRKRMVHDAETEDVLSLGLDTAAHEEGYL